MPIERKLGKRELAKAYAKQYGKEYTNVIYVTASQKQFLDVMLKYRCRILFTTRNRYENHISLEASNLTGAASKTPCGSILIKAESASG